MSVALCHCKTPLQQHTLSHLYVHNVGRPSEISSPSPSARTCLTAPPTTRPQNVHPPPLPVYLPQHPSPLLPPQPQNPPSSLGVAPHLPQLPILEVQTRCCAHPANCLKCHHILFLLNIHIHTHYSPRILPPPLRTINSLHDNPPTRNRPQPPQKQQHLLLRPRRVPYRADGPPPQQHALLPRRTRP